MYFFDKELVKKINDLATKKVKEKCEEMPACCICPFNETWCDLEEMTTALLNNITIKHSSQLPNAFNTLIKTLLMEIEREK